MSGKRPRAVRFRFALAAAGSTALHALVISCAGGIAGYPGAVDLPPKATLIQVRLPAGVRAQAQPVPQAIRDREAPALPRTAAAAPKPAPPAADRPESVLALPAREKYYGPEELDEPPRPAEALVFSYPSDGIAHRAGYLQLTLYIDDSGELERVELGDSDLPQLFADSVEVEMRNVRYLPGRISGRPVKSQLQLRIDFD